MIGSTMLRRLIVCGLVIVNVALLSSTATASTDDPPFQGHCDVCIAGPILFACCEVGCLTPMMCNCNSTPACQGMGEQ